MYNRLFTKILDSSIWLEPLATRVVWITLLAAMDEDGFCSFACPANVARRAGVTLEEAESALLCLESPDKNSGNKANDGRRLSRIEGGYLVLNAKAHREIFSRETRREQTRKRVERYRQSLRNRNADVTQQYDSVTQSEAEAEAEENTNTPPPASPPLENGNVKARKRKEWNPTPNQLEVASWFSRRPTTAWSDREEAAWAKISKNPPDHEDFAILKAYYTSGHAYLRKDLLTLLNNWAGEIDRAKNFAKLATAPTGQSAGHQGHGQQPQLQGTVTALTKLRDEIATKIAALPKAFDTEEDRVKTVSVKTALQERLAQIEKQLHGV